MLQNVFILGATGKVGREVVKSIRENDQTGHRNPTNIVGLSDRKRALFVRGGIPKNSIDIFLSARLDIEELLGPDLINHQGGFESFLPFLLDDQGMDGDLVFIDCTTGQENMRDFHLKIMEQSRNKIVTANKNPIALFDYDTYYRLTKDTTRYSYSATVMAGLGAVPWIRKRAEIGDRIRSITASLSGTIGFITHRLMLGASFSQALKEAIAKGYTESDFRDDLSGLDVKRKLIILAREAGIPAEMKDIHGDALLPREYFEIESQEECLKAIEQELDPKFARDFQNSKKNTLKYVAKLKLTPKGPHLEVGLFEVPKKSKLGQLTGTENFIEVYTDIYHNTPWSLSGPGAGLDITASVIRTDLLDLQPTMSRKPAQ